MVIQPTPPPTAPPPDSLGERFSLVWRRNWEAILLAVIVGIVIEVFFKQMAEQLSKWANRLFHFPFDWYASAPVELCQSALVNVVA